MYIGYRPNYIKSLISILLFCTLSLISFRIMFSFIHHSPLIQLNISMCWASPIKEEFELTYKGSVRIYIKLLNSSLPINLYF
jgi:hypothetical protein